MISWYQYCHATFSPIEDVWMDVLSVLKIFPEVTCGSCKSVAVTVVGALEMTFVLRLNNKDEATIKMLQEGQMFLYVCLLLSSWAVQMNISLL